MNDFLNKNKALLISFFIALISVYFLFYDAKEFTNNPNSIIFTFIIVWGVLWFLTHRFFDVKRKEQLLIKVAVLIAMQIITISIDSYFNIANNPLTFSLEIIIWVLSIYIFVPIFFFKYKVSLLLFYGSILVSFVYIRLFTTLSKEYFGVVINLFIFSVIVAILVWVFEYWKRIQTLKQGKVKAELTLLKSQINPHFLFNTLNNLYGLTVEKSDAAPEVVLKLSDLLRYTIYQGDKNLVPLKQEIEYLKNYIELHKIRYHKNVAITFDYELNSLKVAPLLFIILLENAFKHGVELLTENAYVHICLKTLKNKIIFEIENNFKPNISKTNEGLGLENLKQRLTLIYPEKHKLTIKKTDTVYNVKLEIET
ncbi:histidine kinase [uncultured Tenacibaculum sp.]|uniref:sensor histidine kinase n=1 Tax=uncultured Tenacibaculum sp. TaxID=174713 RepID=UPI0026392BF6|nr:histidine kinase [uncultured Tenacibaculum sp.]